MPLITLLTHTSVFTCPAACLLTTQLSVKKICLPELFIEITKTELQKLGHYQTKSSVDVLSFR